MEITTQHADKVRLYSQDAIRINGLDVQEKFDEAIIDLQEGQKAAFIGSVNKFDIWKRRGWETVTEKTDGPHFYGSDNLKAQFQPNELDYIYADASHLDTQEPEEANYLFDAASKVLKEGGVIQMYLSTLQSGNSATIAEQYNKLGEGLADKGFEISIVMEAPPEEIENNLGKIQIVSIYGKKKAS